MSWKNKVPAKTQSKFPKDPEEEKAFNECRRKYAYAVSYLLIQGIKQSELRGYLEKEDARYKALKKFRQAMVDKRPRARQWVDKPFYIGIKLGELNLKEEGVTEAQLIVNDQIFKQVTQAVASEKELAQYMETLANIIDSEQIWNDPEMAYFNTGEADDGQRYVKKKSTKKEEQEDSDMKEEESKLNLNGEEEIEESDDTEIINTTSTLGRFQ